VLQAIEQMQARLDAQERALLALQTENAALRKAVSRLEAKRPSKVGAAAASAASVPDAELADVLFARAQDEMRTDPESAVRLLQLAADLHHARAMFHFGVFLRDGPVHHLARDVRRGDTLIQAAAAKGDILARAFAALYGIGQKTNASDARTILNEASDVRDACDPGMQYLLGLVVAEEKGLDDGIAYFKRAREAGYPLGLKHVNWHKLSHEDVPRLAA
jgi:TPR repeat protein